MITDLRYAVRQLTKNPGFATVAILTIALGIGANTAIFSLLNQVLLRSLPIHDPERVVLLHFEGVSEGATQSDNGESVFSFPMYKEFRDRNQVFDGLIARASSTVTAIFNDNAERLHAEIVSGNFFEVLGVRPAMGRLLVSTDDLTPGAHPVTVLSYGCWTGRFGGSSSILNQTVRINGLPMTVVGVAPWHFRSVITGQAVDVYVPIAMKAQVTPWANDLNNPRSMWLSLFGRLKPAVTRRQADAGLAPLYRALLQEDLATMPTQPQRFRERFLANRLELRPASQGINQLEHTWEKPLLVVAALVGLVLLIACSNVAGLLVSRAAERQKEMAIRLALGSRRWLLVRQLLIESFLLSLVAAFLGLICSLWIVQGLIGLVPADSLGGWLTAEIDSRLLVFVCGLSVFTCLLFGLTPALSASRLKSALALKSPSGIASKAQARFRRLLVTTQVALSLVLLIAAGLFARSLTNLLRLNPGFRAERLLTFAINPGLSGYTDASTLPLFERLQDRLEALPGVTSVAAAQLTPLGNNNMSTSITAEGYQASEDEDIECELNLISPGYFQTMGVPLVAGREFTGADRADAPKVAIVNEAFAKYFFRDQSPIGRHILQSKGNAKPDIQIVGVVRNSKHSSLREKTARFYYLPYLQEPKSRRIAFFVRTTRDDITLPNEVRSLMREIDLNIPVVNLGWMQARVEESVYIDRLVAWLGGALGALAALLSAVGLYGVVAYVTTRRTTEIGIRMALGALKKDVLWLVMKEATWLAIAGTFAGSLISLALGRLIETQLFGLKAADPIVAGAAVALLSVIILLAGYIPARRAAQVDPMVALRCE